jgi:anti-sigma factor RsiW
MCHLHRESIGAYLLDMLPADRSRELEAHLDECPRCPAELAALTSVADLLSLARAPTTLR